MGDEKTLSRRMVDGEAESQEEDCLNHLMVKAVGRRQYRCMDG